MKPKSASVVILDFLKSKRVTQNVESILAQETDFPVEIIVVDNSVSEENAAKLLELTRHPNVRVKINKKNIGYIRGNNEGARTATGKYLLIVNPDIIWRDTGTLQRMIDYMEKHEDIGILGPRQINESDGQVAMTVRAFPRLFLQIARRTDLRKLPLIRKWVAYDEMRHLDYDVIQNVDWLQSSFWVIRKSLWDSFRGLNPDYFIFMSDPDLCGKVWKKGFRVVYFPKATVYADGLRASKGGLGQLFRKPILRQHLKDSVKYSWNHWLEKNPRS
jgi:N-acetylglucosaminyl-diphospho-decaprenol L-rhamnosyltransferase